MTVNEGIEHVGATRGAAERSARPRSQQQQDRETRTGRRTRTARERRPATKTRRHAAQPDHRNGRRSPHEGTGTVGAGGVERPLRRDRTKETRGPADRRERAAREGCPRDRDRDLRGAAQSPRTHGPPHEKRHARALRGRREHRQRRLAAEETRPTATAGMTPRRRRQRIRPGRQTRPPGERPRRDQTARRRYWRRVGTPPREAGRRRGRTATTTAAPGDRPTWRRA